MNFKQTYKSFIFSSQFVVVYLLTITQTVIIGFFQVFIKSETYSDQQALQVALFSLLITVLFSAVLRLYCSFHMGKQMELINDDDLTAFTKRTFADWAITEIRAQVRILIGCLLFIIPGIVEAIRLCLSIPISFYDKRMSDKSFDPILESRNIIHLKHPKLGFLLFLLIVVPVALSLLFQSGGSSFFESSATMLKAFFAALILALFTSYSYLYMAFLFKETMDTLSNTNDTGDS